MLCYFIVKIIKIRILYDLVYFSTRVPDTSDTSAKRVQHGCLTKDTGTTECYTNDMSEDFDFDHDASENIFPQLKRFILFFLKEFIILDFANFPQNTTV